MTIFTPFVFRPLSVALPHYGESSTDEISGDPSFGSFRASRSVPRMRALTRCLQCSYSVEQDLSRWIELLKKVEVPNVAGQYCASMLSGCREQ